MSHCEHCPVPPGRRCASESHSRFCDLVAKEGNRPGYWNDSVARKSATMDGLPLPVSRKPFPPAAPPDGRIRVGIVSPCCYLGGAERWICDVLDSCDGSRIKWEGIAVFLDGGHAPSLRSTWELHAPVRVGMDAIHELSRRVDVLLTWGVADLPWGISPAAVEAGIPTGLPVITVSHGSVDYPPGPPSGLAGAHSVAVSRAALRGLPGSNRASATIITNAVSPRRVAATEPRSGTRSAWGIPPDSGVVGWLGRLSPEKRPEAFIGGIASLPPGWYGVMVGWGLDEGRYRDLAAEIAPGRVVFAGMREDVGNCLAAFDVLLMTSATEACCLALLEAFEARVPVVSTPVGTLEAGDRPDLARLIPTDPSGAEIASAILADAADVGGTSARVGAAKHFASTEASPVAFGRNWTDYLCSKAPRPSGKSDRPSLDAATRDRVKGCPDRGPVLPISLQDDCGCKGKELSECRSGKGKNTGRVTLRDCLACQAR